jgi:GST-like protein
MKTTQQQAPIKLFGQYGWGSAIIETQFALYSEPYDFVEVGNLFSDPQARAQVEIYNALGQVPTLLLPDGSVMTESAAITLWLADRHNSTQLVPGPQEVSRVSFLRWLVYCVATIYPVYTYFDDPARFVALEEARPAYADAVLAFGKKAYQALEEAAKNNKSPGPWFLGERFSALDLYITTFTHWQPGSEWFAEHAPRLFAIRRATKALPELASIWNKNFPKHINT